MIVFDARTATDHFPGIGRYVVNLTQAMAAEAVLTGLPLTLLQAPSTSNMRLALPNLPHVVCSASPFALRQQWQIPALARRLKAAVYHSPYYLMPYWPGVPTVLTCHDLIPMIYPQYYTARQRLLYRLTHGLALTAAQRVIVVSENTRQDLLQRFALPAAKVTVIPEAADPHFQPAATFALNTARQKYQLPENYALYLGSNKPHKNLARLAQVFGQMLNLTPPIPLIIAGHWDQRYEEAKSLVEKKGWADRIKFIGAIAEADLPALYSGATLFIFPSEYEGFGLPVLEAMACGAPVACSKTSSLPEVAGEAALFFDPHNLAEMAETIRRGLTEVALQIHLRQQGQARAAQFTWTRTAHQTLGLYRSLAGGKA